MSRFATITFAALLAASAAPAAAQDLQPHLAAALFSNQTGLPKPDLIVRFHGTLANPAALAWHATAADDLQERFASQSRTIETSENTTTVHWSDSNNPSSPSRPFIHASFSHPDTALQPILAHWAFPGFPPASADQMPALQTAVQAGGDNKVSLSISNPGTAQGGFGQDIDVSITSRLAPEPFEATDFYLAHPDMQALQAVTEDSLTIAAGNSSVVATSRPFQVSAPTFLVVQVDAAWSVNNNQVTWLYQFELPVQPPDSSPLLSITLETSTTARISWNRSLENFTLESTTALASGNWQTVEETPSVDEEQFVVRVQISEAAEFFRLRQ